MSNWLKSPYTWIILIVSIVVIFLSYMSNNVDNAWYRTLDKPPGVVPDYVFGIIWGVLYFLIVLAGIVAVNLYKGNKTALTFLYSVILIMTLGWILAFSQGENMTLGLIILQFIIALTVAILVMTKPNAIHNWIPLIGFGLFFIWICVATYYNSGFLALNPTKDTHVPMDV